MQQEIRTETPASKIRILGVNRSGREGGIALIDPGVTLPLPQDTPAARVFTAWNVTYRDVVVLDEENRAVAVYNLTANNLQIPERYEELKALLRKAAGE